MISKRVGNWVCLSLVVVAGCAAGSEDTDVVTSQETTLARCPAATSEHNERTKPADTVNNGPGGSVTTPAVPGKEGDTATRDQATAAQPGCDPGKNAGGGFGSRGAAESAQQPRQ